jgi:aspartyl-tRNA(Asn)/glutamyl-tRNA(Gln) amidotransferase subunit A
MSFSYTEYDATGLAELVRTKKVSAVELTAAVRERVEKLDPTLNCYTTPTWERAEREAASIDASLAKGESPGPLTGVPFGVKDLFDIAGVTTIAGSKIHREQPPAKEDARAVKSLHAAGGVLTGALNMDEYAYGFSTINAHYGPTKNPWDLKRIAGGSSGGSAAAVAAGLLPLTLGSDTNGSIRVPSSLCGIFGLKPTYGRLSRSGAFPFVGSLDHIGPFARSVRDLALAFDLLQGADPNDPVCTTRATELCVPELVKLATGLRVAVADGYFRQAAEPIAFQAVDKAAKALGVTQTVSLPQPGLARAAAYVITGSEGGQLHYPDLKKRAQDFDPATRDRFLAGNLYPANWYLQAQRFRSWYRAEVAKLFETVDVILAPATPLPAPFLDQHTMILDGREMPVRPHLGLFTQPISFIGLPVVAVPIHGLGPMPIGVQVIGAAYQEAKVLRVAAALEALGVGTAPVAEPKV